MITFRDVKYTVKFTQRGTNRTTWVVQENGDALFDGSYCRSGQKWVVLQGAKTLLAVMHNRKRAKEWVNENLFEIVRQWYSDKENVETEKKAYDICLKAPALSPVVTGVDRVEVSAEILWRMMRCNDE